MPPDWQTITLSESCEGETAATIHHEYLHAIGFEHEHVRPDRDDYIIVSTENSTHPSEFAIMNTESWTETRYPFELDSVMTYCSMCSSIGDYPVATLKDGTQYPSGARLTTTDVLQVHDLYCLSPTFEPKRTVSCKYPDILGFKRQVFVDRLCNNQLDCYEGEDEDGTLENCVMDGIETPDGCCEKLYIVHNLEGYCKEFVYDDQWMDYAAYACKEDKTQVILHDVNTWIWSIAGYPTKDDNGQYSLEYIAHANSMAKCPSTIEWEGNITRVRCKVKPSPTLHTSTLTTLTSTTSPEFETAPTGSATEVGAGKTTKGVTNNSSKQTKVVTTTKVETTTEMEYSSSTDAATSGRSSCLASRTPVILLIAVIYSSKS